MFTAPGRHKAYGVRYTCTRQEKKLGVRGPDQSAKCAVVLNVPYKRSWCAVKLCPPWHRWNHVEQRPAPFRPEHSLPSSQATTDSVYKEGGPAYYTFSGFASNPGSAATGIMYIDIVLYFSFSSTVSWNTPQMVYLHSIDFCYLLG